MSEGEESEEDEEGTEDWEEDEDNIEVEPEEHATACLGCKHEYGNPDCAECPSYDGSASDFEEEEIEEDELG